MVLPAQFQLGLELTNIVNPISQAMSALGSLAVMDAIRKSGSDFITETKLANLIGRHRIDPAIKFHFREMVTKSDQSIISRYMDIILESGSGPTVQEALKNPALFSMVIQLSALAFAHDNESLANTLVEAIEKIVQESNSDTCIVPDYVSLLGTIRACQQQTAAFRWALLYEATEEKIRMRLAGLDKQTRKKAGVTYSVKSSPLPEKYEYEQCRALPIAVLQGLSMWLHSIQSFPEHRLLHVTCSTGLSTVVVWCHYVLGLSLIINIRDIEICFGDGPFNLVVVHNPYQNAGVSLMDPLDIHEPLFTLQSDQLSAGTAYDHRAEAWGYGRKFIQYADIPMREHAGLPQIVKSRTIEVCEQVGTSDMVSDPGSDSVVDIGPRYPSRSRLLSAWSFLFSSEESATMPTPKPSSDLYTINHPIVQALVAVVITFARISEDDLTRCKEMPLALNVLTSNRNQRVTAFTHGGKEEYFDVLESFELLSLLLLGHNWYHDYDNPAVLWSAWGWSAFLDSIDDIDPFDVSINTLRVMPGVPSRQGVRKNRIIDGPPKVVPRQYWYCPNDVFPTSLAAAVGTAEKDIILVGHHNDAFQVTQQFKCRNQSHSVYRYGFRAMAEWSTRSRRFPPCQCYDSTGEQPSGTKLETIDRVLEEEETLMQRSGPRYFDLHQGSERVFSSRDSKNLFTYVSDSPAARWLQLATIYGESKGFLENRPVVLVGRDTCAGCAIRNSKRLPPPIVFVL